MAGGNTATTAAATAVKAAGEAAPQAIKRRRMTMHGSTTTAGTLPVAAMRLPLAAAAAEVIEIDDD